jgi:hypothetical protein
VGAGAQHPPRVADVVVEIGTGLDMGRPMRPKASTWPFVVQINRGDPHELPKAQVQAFTGCVHRLRGRSPRSIRNPLDCVQCVACKPSIRFLYAMTLHLIQASAPSVEAGRLARAA